MSQHRRFYKHVGGLGALLQRRRYEIDGKYGQPASFDARRLDFPIGQQRPNADTIGWMTMRRAYHPNFKPIRQQTSEVQPSDVLVPRVVASELRFAIAGQQWRGQPAFDWAEIWAVSLLDTPESYRVNTRR